MDRTIPCRIKRLRPGDVVQQAGGLCAIVLGAEPDGRRGTLATLPGGHSFTVRLEDMADWEVARLPGPRLVHVRGKGKDTAGWSAYLPDFESACALWRELEGRSPELFEVEICAQHIDEKLVLHDIGYYQEPVRQAG